MKKIRLLILLGSLLLAENSAALDLEGVWKSDLDSSMTFNSINAKLEKRQEAFLRDLFGKMTITYKNETAYLNMPSTKVTVNGELRNFTGFKNTQKYRILAQDRDTIIIEFIDGDGKKEISLLKFEGENKYWIYLPNSSSPWSQLHIREYFVRQE
jgi:hypothetical protein